MTTNTTHHLANAIRLVTAQTLPENCDTQVLLYERLYQSRDVVHSLQEQIELVNSKSKLLVASFSRYR